MKRASARPNERCSSRRARRPTISCSCCSPVADRRTGLHRQPASRWAQKQDLNRALLRSGAGIGAINTGRKHLSRIKGGRLARAAQPAAVLTFAISDVPNDDPAVIASGPTVADPTTLADARAVLQRFGIDPDPAIARALNDPANESCKADDPALSNARFTLIARPRHSLDAAIAAAKAADFEVVELGELEGEAREVGEHTQHFPAKRMTGDGGLRSCPAANSR